MLCCSCCLSCKYIAVLLQLRCFSSSELHWYFDAVFRCAVLMLVAVFLLVVCLLGWLLFWPAPSWRSKLLCSYSLQSLPWHCCNSMNALFAVTLILCLPAQISCKLLAMGILYLLDQIPGVLVKQRMCLERTVPFSHNYSCTIQSCT